MKNMAINHYVINHRLLIRMQKDGHIFCAICHKPIVEGQRVASRKGSAVRHEDCYQRSFI
ncbi:MAG: hypothetical protein NWE92_08680 [Candidatus Bathyarchaeota archaeon]|nr:hypothetical protein [Candidatus Bathyarchaeota archaeon]